MFVQPGDIVGIKVNPVGQPHVISAAEVVREIIAGLNAAGIKNKDIVVYDRYHDQFFKAGFDKWLPDRVRTSNAVADYEDVQQSIEGYDPDHYMDMALALPGQDATNLTARRSYAANFISKEVNKLINLPVLKDHQSAGVTLELRNVIERGAILCQGERIGIEHLPPNLTPMATPPELGDRISLDKLEETHIRRILAKTKLTLPDMDVIELNEAFAAQVLACVRQLGLDDRDPRLNPNGESLPRERFGHGQAVRSAFRETVAEARPDKYSTFLSRQPEHIEIAGALGLGEWNESKIDIRRIRL